MMLYINGRKNHFIITGLFAVFICIFIMYQGVLQNRSRIYPPVSGGAFQQTAAATSKARIVEEIRQLTREVADKEERLGQTGPGGYKVYSPRESGELFNLYQAITERLDYLNHGRFTIRSAQWDGYTFDAGDNVPFTTTAVQQAVTALDQANLPPVFLKQLRIFILPYSIPEVSGLGGAGYLMLSACPAGVDLIDNQLTVTLYHEIGHHVHMQFMPENTAKGRELWREYLAIQGGTWHEPGQVNTTAWSSSSEENFAEDFRMLFGKDQPYFGDMSLGDPRVHPLQASKLRTFIKNLGRERFNQAYQSPWVPTGSMVFWRLQTGVIVGLWFVLAAGYGILYRHYQPGRLQWKESKTLVYKNMTV